MKAKGHRSLGSEVSDCLSQPGRTRVCPRTSGLAPRALRLRCMGVHATGVPRLPTEDTYPRTALFAKLIVISIIIHIIYFNQIHKDFYGAT